MKNLMTACFVVTMALVPFTMIGCKPAESTTDPAPTEEHGEHEGHDEDGEHEGHGEHGEEGDHKEPETFAEAVTMLGALHTKISEAMKNDDKDAAHGPLHEVGHVLEEVEELADSASLNPLKLAAVKKATETLFDGYEKIDGMFHGEKEVKFDTLSKGLDTALAVLTDAVKGEASKETPKKKVRKPIPKDPSMVE